MSILTRLFQSTQTPDGGGTAFDSINTTSGSTSFSTGGSKTDTAKWFNLATNDIPYSRVKVRLKFDWNVGGTLDVSVDASGTASASYSFSIDGASSSNSISVNGPGPVSDHLNISDGGSVDLDVTGTALGSVDLQASLNGEASSTGTGVADSSPSCSISNIRIEITMQDGSIIVL